MAAFCTKCGSPLGSGTGFCPACGTPIAAAAAPVAPVPSAPQAQAYPPPPAAAPPSAYAAPAYGAAPYAQAPPQKRSSAGKIILIIVLVIVGLGVLGALGMGWAAWRVARSVNVNKDGSGMTMTIPGGGSITAGDSTATDAELGVPAYPGATREKGGMNMSAGTASMVMAHFATGDSENQVVDYYKGKMGDAASVVSTGNGTVISSGSKDTERVMVTVAPGSGDDAGKTTIVIMHTQKKGGA